VDGAYGAPVLMLAEYADWRGIVARADSFSFDLHKWFALPMGTGVLLLRDGSLKDSFAVETEVIRRPTLVTSAPDQCQMGIQGTRRLDGLRVFGALSLIGFAELERRIRKTLWTARYLAECIDREPCLQLIAEPSLSVVVFAPVECDLEMLSALCSALAVEGTAFLTVTTANGKPALRACIVSSETGQNHIDDLISAIVEYVVEP
jgi:L-2,4-diaminobutyrate decarboxylase